MLNSIVKNISNKSLGLLPTPKSVWMAFFSIIIIAGSAWLITASIKSFEPKKPDLKNESFMRKIYEKEYLLNKNKLKNASN